MGSDTLEFTRVLDAPPEDAFYAFSTAQGWRDWLCDSAHFRPRSTQSFLLGWQGGWQASGSIVTLEKPERVELSWFGKGEPGPSMVAIELRPKDQGTEVQIKHSGLGEGEGWDQAREQIRKGWEIGLENLESIFSTGVDLRVARQPMMGIMLNDFNERIAGEIGVPITEGVRVAEAIEGMGAEKAGLQTDDVIVEMAGIPVRAFGDLGAALRGQKAGDTVSVSLYRGEQKITVKMELSGRPLAEASLDPSDLADRVGEIFQRTSKELREFLDGVSEAEAEFKPAPTEWSVKETLAHLIDAEQYSVHMLTEMLSDGEREFAEGGENNPILLAAMVSVTPTIPALLERLEATQREVLYILKHGDKLKKRKGVLWRLAQGWLQYPASHEHMHMEQMGAAIEAARAAEGVATGD